MTGHGKTYEKIKGKQVKPFNKDELFQKKETEYNKGKVHGVGLSQSRKVIPLYLGNQKHKNLWLACEQCIFKNFCKSFFVYCPFEVSMKVDKKRKMWGV